MTSCKTSWGFFRHNLLCGPGHSHRTTIGYSCWNCICFSTLDISQFCGSTSGSFGFIMTVSPYVGHLFDLFREIWAYMGGIFIGIIPIHSYRFETSPALCSNGMVSVILILLCPLFLIIFFFKPKIWHSLIFDIGIYFRMTRYEEVLIR